MTGLSHRSHWSSLSHVPLGHTFKVCPSWDMGQAGPNLVYLSEFGRIRCPTQKIRCPTWDTWESGVPR